ncbi:MAG: adenine nucleotide alpha hydrolase family protein [Chloroflexi bacterium]|nr:adenine nucleotide alpha hydrolase family protein [Chloroflexota bacterium]
MRCLKCQERAWVELKRHHAAYCAPHYTEFFERQVERNIKAKKMFTLQDKILVAVSGGKDSLALWDVLVRAGYQTAGLYIDLGISDYSMRSKEKAMAFAGERGLPLIVKDVRAEYGDGLIGISELSKALRRVPCSGCGLTKRYLLNQVAHEHGYNVLATGHNLDDEAATLMGNVLHWQMDYLARQSPVLESTHPHLAKKVKPLYTFTERETLSYVLIKGIDYIEEECPNAQGAQSIVYKEALNAIEAASPGSKQAFVDGFLKSLQPVLHRDEAGVTLNACSRCGEPTTGEVCAFCRMWERAKAAKAKGKAVIPTAS